MSDHLPIGRLCVHTQGKLELSIESRDITVLGTMDLLEMRGTFTVLKLRRCLSGLGSGAIQDLVQEVFVHCSVVANAMGLQVLGPGALRYLASDKRVITAGQSGAVCQKCFGAPGP